MKYDKGLGLYQSIYRIGIRDINVSVYGEANMSSEIHGKKVKRVVDYINEKYHLILKAISDELIEVKNDGWLNVNEDPISTDRFESLITPRRIEIFEDESIEIGWNDGGIFWGHEIIFRTDSELSPTWIDMEG